MYKRQLWLSAADRVYLVLSEFSAATFEELFQGVKAIAWADYLPKTALFPVLADSVRSTLKSVPDIQSVSKKAVVEALKSAYGLSFFRESEMCIRDRPSNKADLGIDIKIPQ